MACALTHTDTHLSSNTQTMKSQKKIHHPKAINSCVNKINQSFLLLLLLSSCIRSLFQLSVCLSASFFLDLLVCHYIVLNPSIRYMYYQLFIQFVCEMFVLTFGFNFFGSEKCRASEKERERVMWKTSEQKYKIILSGFSGLSCCSLPHILYLQDLTIDKIDVFTYQNHYHKFSVCCCRLSFVTQSVWLASHSFSLLLNRMVQKQK